MNQPIDRMSVPDHVFARLSEAILAGEYSAGERLPSQRALAEDLGVNLASVREALGRLEQLRLIDVRHGDGARVRDWRRTGGLETLLHASVEPSMIGDLFEARRVLLAESARLAAERRSEEQARDLLSLADAVAFAVDDHAALLADWVFMEALVRAAGNIVFQLITNSVRELYLPHAHAFAPLVRAREDNAQLYARAARAVLEGDGADAAAAIEELARAQAAGMLG